MTPRRPTQWIVLAWILLGACATCAGCYQMPPRPGEEPSHPAWHGHLLPGAEHPPDNMPRELEKVTLPEYRISPPDVLAINALRVVPRPPYRIQPLDLLAIQADPSLPLQPIQGLYSVETDGAVSLGFGYGSIFVMDLTIPEAKKVLEEHLKTIINPKIGIQVNMSLAQSRGLLQIRGDHLVKQDGTIGLGSYGSVLVAGLTVAQAKVAIEAQLTRFLAKPEVSVEVSGFNSKVYYVLTDGGGNGEQLLRLPITGSETVLDAVSMVNGLSPVSSRHRIWIARPGLGDGQGEQVLPVDWIAITQEGKRATNYQIIPGDRVYIKANPLITLDTALVRIITPIERVFGVSLLGNATIQNLKRGSTTSSSSSGGF